MSQLDERLDRATKPHHNSTCWFDKLPDDDAREFVAQALEERAKYRANPTTGRRIPLENIAQILKEDWGFPVQGQTIGRHEKRLCPCPN